MRDTIVFDLDGTIADTAGDLIAAANAALAAMGHGARPAHGRRRRHGVPGGRAMLELAATRLALPDGRRIVEDGYPILLEAYGQAIDPHDALSRRRGGGRAAARAGAATAICTNKPEKLAIDLIDRLSLSRCSTRWSGPIRCRCASPTPRPISPPWTAAAARWRGRF
jgi:phosphoglycolate phosphatase